MHKTLQHTLPIAAVLAAALLSIPFVSAQGNGRQKETICHKGTTIMVAAPAVSAHMNHGDTMGECEDSGTGSMSSMSSSTMSGSGSTSSGSGSSVDMDEDENRGPFFGIIKRIDLCHEGELIRADSIFDLIVHILHGDQVNECPSDEDDGSSSSSMMSSTGSSVSSGTGSMSSMSSGSGTVQ